MLNQLQGTPNQHTSGDSLSQQQTYHKYPTPRSLLETIPEDSMFTLCRSELLDEYDGQSLDISIPRIQLNRIAKGLKKLGRVCRGYLRTLLGHGFRVMKKSPYVSRRYRNIQLYNIAREKIIPYVSQVFVQSSQTKASLSLSRTTAVTRGSSVKGSRRLQMSSDYKRRQFRFNLRMEKVKRNLLLRKGLNAIREEACSQIDRRSQAQEFSMSSSFGSLFKQLFRNTPKKQNTLGIKIISKYALKALMSIAFEKISDRAMLDRIEQGTGVLLRVMKLRYKTSFCQIEGMSRISKGLGTLDKFLRKWTVRSELLAKERALIKLKSIKKCQGVLNTGWIVGLSTLSKIAQKSKIKLLFHAFYKLKLFQGAKRRDFNQIDNFLSILNNYFDKRLTEHSDNKQQHHAFQETRLRMLETTYSTDRIMGKHDQRAQMMNSFVVLQTDAHPIIQIGASLPMICLQEPPLNFRPKRKIPVQSRPLKPAVRDVSEEFTNRSMVKLNQLLQRAL